MEKVKKNKEFLSQIPAWEKNYKESDEMAINFHKKEWIDAGAEFSEHTLRILGEPVMEDWETPYMEELAEVACLNGGVVLELGFGMAISAKFIQQHNIQKHIIIEANRDVAQKAREFAQSAPHEVEVLEGFWEEVIERVPDGSIDGILFDTYPVTELELYQNHFSFFPFAYRKLREGGVFTYYSDEVDGFGAVHLKRLKEAGFQSEKIQSRITKVIPPKDCEYWKANTMLTPIVKK
jgi:guanidinoacetate N-methyltransferase